MSSFNNLQKVFVYGTLKRGEPNHDWFSKDNSGYHRFICEAKTVEKYPLIIGTKYNIPFLLYKPDFGNLVKGELYEVDDKMLQHLDVLEDHPNFYIREIKKFQPLPIGDTNKQVEAWVYFIKNFKNDLLKQTMYENYSNYDLHGLNYVKRYQRDPNYSTKAEVFTENHFQ